MAKIIIPLFVSMLLISNAHGADGQIEIKSTHTVSATAGKAIKVLESKGMKIFARVDHGAGAKSVGNGIGEMELVIFGNPKIGSKLMACAPTVGIDLPQKFLIFKQGEQTIISYNDPMYLNKRHGLKGCEAVLEKVSGALNKMANAIAN